jgi:hypothetical protein
VLKSSLISNTQYANKRRLDPLSPVSNNRASKASKSVSSDELYDEIDRIIAFVNVLAEKLDNIEDKVEKIENTSPKSMLSWVDKVCLSSQDDNYISVENKATVGSSDSEKKKPQSSIISSFVDVTEKKRRSLIIFGVNESKTSVVRDKIDHYRNHVETIAKLFDIDKTKIANVFRFRNNSYSSRPAPIRLVLNSSTDRDHMLRQAHKLKGSTLDGVYIKPDLNDADLQREKELILECNAKLTSEPR